MKSNRIHFVLGGSRSGKSAFAENLALHSNLPVVYIATCRTNGLDTEMEERLQIHRKRRPAEWTTVENNFDLSQISQQHAGSCMLIDSLSSSAGRTKSLIMSSRGSFRRASNCSSSERKKSARGG